MKGVFNIKRIGNIWDDICDLDNCIKAVRNATRFKYKLNRPGSFVFTVASNPHYYGYLVSNILKSMSYHPANPNCFNILEGIKQKPRSIKAPKLFPDQVVHWSIMQVLSPLFQKSFYYYNCGSIPGKGPELVKRYLTKTLSIDTKNHVPVRTWYKYCLKLDIYHFFQSINKEILMQKLHRFFKDKYVLEILADIIYSIDDEGLPIGYYTSQWLANFYLADFDHWLKKRVSELFKHNVYIRYVDDIVMIGSNKRKLKQLLNEISQKLKDDYDLKLKYDTPDQIFDIGKRPIDFVGFKFTYGSTTVRNAIFRRAIYAEKKANKTIYTIKNLSGILSYNGWIGTRNVVSTKNHFYSHSDGHYKYYLNKCKNDYKYKKKINTINANRQLRQSIFEMSETDYMNEVVVLRKFIWNKDDNKYELKELDRRSINDAA